MNAVSAWYRALYNLIVLPLAAAAAIVASPFHAKLASAVRGRRGWRGRWKALRLDRPVWFHVASVGEFEQARPVISAMAATRPNIPVMLTFASPSGLEYFRRKETIDSVNSIRFADYYPSDFPRAVDRCLDLANPRLMVYVKFDIWPNLVWRSHRRGIPSILIDATLSSSSKRAFPAARRFYASVYRDIDRILTIGTPDASRFRTTVADHPHIEVAGDTRFDRVAERARTRAPLGFEWVTGDGPVIVCGSTWPKDEAHLLPALSEILSACPDSTAVIAPHEPTASRLVELEQWARSRRLRVVRAGDLRRGDPVTGQMSADGVPRVILIDSVGILAEVYRHGDIAYVGGSFSTGVHSVIEPAIEGLPTVFGPNHHNSLEALRLIDAGAAFAAGDSLDIKRRLEFLIADPGSRRQAGAAARSYVESQLGATEKCMAALARHL